MVAGLGAGLPKRLHDSQCLAHSVPIAHHLRGGAVRHLRNPDPMSQAVSHGGPVFAVLSELRPVLLDWRVILQAAAVGQHVDASCRDSLGRREHREEGLSVHGAARVLIRKPRPRIDNELSVEVGGGLKPHLLPGLHQRFEHCSYPSGRLFIYHLYYSVGAQLTPLALELYSLVLQISRSGVLQLTRSASGPRIPACVSQRRLWPLPCCPRRPS